MKDEEVDIRHGVNNNVLCGEWAVWEVII